MVKPLFLFVSLLFVSIKSSEDGRSAATEAQRQQTPDRPIITQQAKQAMERQRLKLKPLPEKMELLYPLVKDCPMNTLNIKTMVSTNTHERIKYLKGQYLSTIFHWLQYEQYGSMQKKDRSDLPKPDTFDLGIEWNNNGEVMNLRDDGEFGERTLFDYRVKHRDNNFDLVFMPRK